MGQSPASTQLEVRGTVLEASTRQPIGGVEVSLTRLTPGSAAVVGGYRSSALMKTITGDFGNFAFRVDEPGNFRIEARKTGYVAPGPEIRGFEPAVTVTLESGAIPEGVDLLLARESSIAGRVINADSGEPVQGLQVRAYVYYYRRGEPSLFPGSQTVTDPAGHFELGGLTPGEYLVEVRSLPPNAPAILAGGIAPEDLSRTELQYYQAFWPGGRDLLTAWPERIESGMTVDLGNLAAQKGPAHRVRISTQALRCGPADRAQAEVDQVSASTHLRRAQADVPCNRDLSIRGLPPGHYELKIWMRGRRAQERERLWIPFEVTNQDFSLDAVLQPGVEISGKITAPEGAMSAIVERMKIGLRPVGGINFADEGPSVASRDGGFRLLNVERREQALNVQGLPETYYIHEIKYNGRVVSGTILAIDALAVTHSLELVVRDDPAILAGTVKTGDKPAVGARVVLLPWPSGTPLDAQRSTRMAITDEAGYFRFEALPPREYRLAALSQRAASRLEEPGALQALLNDGTGILLQARAVQSVQLNMVRDP